jgi:DNA (cytosine-5)-methyltransferase 1
MTIKLFEAFAGYGGAGFALKKANIPFECVGYSEIDKYAIQCYEQNHKGKNFGDITKINPNDLPDFDLFTGGFPCPSFSLAGKGLGEEDKRGILFWEIIKICAIKQPKYILLENVKGLTTKKHIDVFQSYIEALEKIGYFVLWNILDTKENGIPQSRQRVFIICFKDFEEAKKFKFPGKKN